MDLVEYYQNTPKVANPKKEIREKIKKAVGCNDATVYRYLNGSVVPNKLTQQAIANVLNKSVEELFPSSEEN